MKKLLSVGLVALCAATLPASAETRIALIDLQKSFKEYYKTKQAEVEFQEKVNSARKESQDMMVDYNAGVEKLKKVRAEAENQSLTKEAQAKAVGEYQKLVQELTQTEKKIREFNDMRMKMLQDSQMRLRENLLEEIKKVVNDYSSAQGYNLVFDKSAMSGTATPFILFAQGVKEISDDVTMKLNATKPAGAAAAAPAAAPVARPATPVAPPATPAR